MDWGGCVVNDVATLQCVPIIFNNLIFWATGLAAIVAVFFIMFSGVKFLTSGGDPKQVEGARKTMTYAIAGLVLILISFAIIKLISIFTGVSCITAFGFNNCQ
jgi:hypothetical protein